MPAKKATAAKAAPPRTQTEETTTPDDTAEEFDFTAAPWLDADGTPYPVSVLIGRILAELPAIGKGQYNSQQNYSFRGVDDVLNALNPLLSKWGVFVVPHSIEVVPEDSRQFRSGGTMYVAKIVVRYRWYGPAGDFIEATGIGEGTDSLDKASPKAMTGAFKYMLFETLAISTAEAAATDADRGTPDTTATSDVTVHSCPVCAEAGTAYQHRDAEKVRQHLVDRHGWARTEDGRVRPGERPSAPSAPAEAPSTPADATTPEPAATTPPAATATPEPTTAADESEAPADDEIDPAEEVAWVDDLKGSALIEKAKELGLSPAGKVDEIRQRIKDFLLAPEEEDPLGVREDEAETRAAEGDGDTTDAEGEFYQCPDCDAAPFATEDEYTSHWSEVHGSDEAEVETEPEGDDDPDGPADADSIAAVKKGLAKLEGQAARAYGEYRRKNSLPRPDELTQGQADAVLTFLDTL